MIVSSCIVWAAGPLSSVISATREIQAGDDWALLGGVGVLVSVTLARPSGKTFPLLCWSCRRRLGS